MLSRLRPTLRRLAVAAAALSASLALLFAASPANASGANYVALGDSYSSGLGAGSYYTSSGSCYRSSKAYPQLWANAHAPASYAFVACSGATTTDVASSQLYALNSATTLISITIGGNDVGFASVMETCVLGSTSDCVSAVETAEYEAETQLPGELDSLYSKMKADAPNARVVVLGYPEFYDLSLSDSCIGLSTTDRYYLNQGADVLDSVIQTEAVNYGFTYAGVISAFYGHELCDSNPWLHSVDWLWFEDSYHPNASGHAYAYYPVFNNNTY